MDTLTIVHDAPCGGKGVGPPSTTVAPFNRQPTNEERIPLGDTGTFGSF